MASCEISDEVELDRLRESCRVCLRSQGVLNIFLYSSVLDKLLACTDMRIHKNDGLPDSVCRNCKSNLDQAFNFRMQCIESDKKLQQLLMSVFPDKDMVKKEEHNINQHTEMPPADVEHVVIKTEVDDYISDNDSLTQAVDSMDVEPFFNIHDNEEIEGNVSLTENNNFENKAEERSSGKNRKGHTSLKKLICHYCQNRFTDRKKYRVHVQKHKEETYECDVCNKRFRGAKNIERHKNAHVQAEQHPCQFCGKMMSRSKLQSHIEEKHLMSRKECPICHQLLCVGSLPGHILRHEDLNIPCEICSKTFKTKMSLRDHLKTHSEVRAYPCSFCEKRFSCRKGKVEHERIHTGVKPYKCPLCDAAFAQRTGVKSHFKNRHREYDYLEEKKKQKESVRSEYRGLLTTECPNETPSESHQSSASEYLNEALSESHHTASGCLDNSRDAFKEFSTRECLNGETAAVGNTIQSSEVVQLAQWSNPPPIISKVADLISTRANIQRKDDLQMSCEICSKTFKTKAGLRYHLKTHSRVKDEECSFCGKRFTASQARIVHERVHTGDKPYECPMCDKSFSQQAGVISHFNNRHKEHDYAEERKRQRDSGKTQVKESADVKQYS